MDNSPISPFEKTAAEQSDTSFPVELWNFLRHNKKWWLLPILAVLLLFGMVMFFSASAAAPFIYTLF